MADDAKTKDEQGAEDLSQEEIKERVDVLLEQQIVPQRRTKMDLYLLWVKGIAKVGDTTRGACIRYKEWKKKPGFEDCELIWDADISKGYGDKVPRDHTFHKALKGGEHPYRNLSESDIRQSPNFPDGMYFSRELFDDGDFFAAVSPDDAKKRLIGDLEEIKARIDADHASNGQRFALYSLKEQEEDDGWDGKKQDITLRPAQQEMVDNFKAALARENNPMPLNLLCAAPPRYGKSITTMSCANEMGAKGKKVIITSAKVDVADEWKKTIERVSNFSTWTFLDRKDLTRDPKAIAKALSAPGKGDVAVFVSLEDFQGDDVKDVHAEIFEYDWDLLVVDEVHYGADGESFGKKIKADPDEDIDAMAEQDEENERKSFSALKGRLSYKVRLDLSGTPYDILMSGKFDSDDIVYQASYEDIIAARDQWYADNPDAEEQDNPYYDFPDCVSIGWDLSNADKKALDKYDGKFKLLFEAVKKADGTYKFVNEEHVMRFLQAFDGSSSDSGAASIIGSKAFLDNMETVHAVMVLPSCAACDAMKLLIDSKRGDLAELGKYDVYQLTGTKDAAGLPKSPRDVKKYVSDKEKEGKNTLCLTVDRMMTGVSVPEWNLMIYAKNCSSAQSYEQAKCRIFTPYSVTSEDGIKVVKKQQGIFIDCFPSRLFEMEETKARAQAKAESDSRETAAVYEQMEKNVNHSTILLVDSMQGHFKKMKMSDIRREITEFNDKKPIIEQMEKLVFNDELLEDENVANVLSQMEITNTGDGALKIDAFERSEDDDAEDIDKLRDHLAQEEEAEKDRTAEDDTGDEPYDEDDEDDGSEERKDENDEYKELRKKMREALKFLVIVAFFMPDGYASIRDLLEICAKKNSEGKKLREMIARFGLGIDFIISIDKVMDEHEKYKLEKIMYNANTLRYVDDMTDIEKIEALTKRIGNFSPSEFITPKKTVKKMLKALFKNSDDLRSAILNGKKILCLAEEVGEFSVALKEKLEKDLDLPPDMVRDAIYSTYDGNVARAVLPGIFEMAKLDPEHICIYGSEEIYGKIKESNKYSEVAELLKNQNAWGINPKQKKESLNMINFEAIVGNPPYQEGSAGRQDDKAIYHHFYNIGKELSNKVVLITKAGYLYNSGKGLGNFTEKILNDPHFSVIEYWEDGSEVFPGTIIKGGVAIGIYDAKNEGKPVGFFSQYAEMNSILSKVKNKNEPTLDTIHYSNSSCKYSEVFKREHSDLIENLPTGSRRHLVSKVFDLFPTIFLEEKPDDDEDYGVVVGRGGGKRTKRYMRRDYFNPADNYDFYKVWLPKANANGVFGEIFAQPMGIGYPGETSTETCFSHGCWRTVEEADNYIKYYRTKTYRALAGTLKVTQNSSSAKIWSNVPLQNFTPDSDIDWSKSITEIDQQLYEKYGFTEEEIAFIEENVKPME